jgi:hypothetical protein
MSPLPENNILFERGARGDFQRASSGDNSKGLEYAARKKN